MTLRTRLAAVALALGSAGLIGGAALAQEGGARDFVEEVEPAHQNWSFNGVFGTFDRAAAQRGFQIYSEICSACHAMRLLAFRNLADLGFTEEQVAAIAAQRTVVGGPNDQGEMFERPATPADRFPSPFPNEQAARAANNGAYPPDLSVIVDARYDGADYIYAFLTGFADPPEGMEIMPGMNYNVAFPGHQTAMPDMIQEGGVTYSNGTAASEQQQAWDVVNFLAWASEPNMEERKLLGVQVVLFLVVFTAFIYALKRKIWADAGH